MLYRHDAPGGKALAVAYPINLIENGFFFISGAQEVTVQTVCLAVVLNRPRSSNKRLPDYLPPVYALPSLVRAGCQIVILFDFLKVEDFDDFI